MLKFYNFSFARFMFIGVLSPFCLLLKPFSVAANELASDKIIITDAVVGDAVANGELSPLKLQSLEYEKEIAKNQSDNLRLDWINPISASYSTTDNEFYSPTLTTNLFSVSLNQPIFKSGGIYYAILYADTNRENLQKQILKKQKELYKNLYAGALAIKKQDLAIEKQKLLIENAKIDVERKNEQYKNGFLDASFIDNALLTLNSLENSLLDLQNQRLNSIVDFEKISQKDYTLIEIPKFILISKEQFLKNSIDYKIQEIKTKESEYLKKMVISTFLPTVSINASYNLQDTKPAILGVREGEYYQYGIKISVPILDVNMQRDIEIKKLEHLKTSIELADKEIEVKTEFYKIQNEIQNFTKKIELAKKEASIYSSLVESTKEETQAGRKTGFDLETMQNSYKKSLIEQKIYELDISIKLCDLHSKVGDEI